MQTPGIQNVNPLLTRPTGGEGAERKDRAERADALPGGGYPSKDLDAAYIKRTNSYAFELNLSEPARQIIADLNDKARQAQLKAEEKDTEDPGQPAALIGGLPPSLSALPAPDPTPPEPIGPQLPPTILETYGEHGEAAQSFLRDFFDGGGAQMRRYQDKLGQLIDSMNGGYQMGLIDRMNMRENPDPDRTVFSMEAPNGSRMRLFMTEKETQNRLTITYLNRETGSYDLDILKQDVKEAEAQLTALKVAQKAAAEAAGQEPPEDTGPTLPLKEGTVAHVHEIGRRMIHGRLNPDPDYNHREIIAF